MKYTLRRIYKSIRYINKTLIILLVISVYCIVVIDFDISMLKVPELFKGGAKAEGTIYAVSVSIVSGFIFYYFTVYQQEVKGRSLIFPRLAISTNNILTYGLQLAQMFRKKCGESPLLGLQNDEEIKLLSEKINPSLKENPMFDSNGPINVDWFEYFYHFRNKSNEEINKIYNYQSFTSTPKELISLMIEVQECSFFKSVFDVQDGLPIRRDNLKYFEQSLIEYFNLLRRVQDFYDSHLKDYYNEYFKTTE